MSEGVGDSSLDQSDRRGPLLAPSPRARLIEIARYFTRLGFTAFGGPAAHIALMEDELVHRRHWLDRQHFLDLIASIHFIPGPNSTQLAIALGRLRGGRRGLVLAGVCFIGPAVLIILPIAWLYVRFNQLPQVAGIFRGVSAAVIAIIASVVLRLAKSAARNRIGMVIAIAAAIAEGIGHRFQFGLADLSILALAALMGMLTDRGKPPSLLAAIPSPERSSRVFRSIAWSMPSMIIAPLPGGPLLMSLRFLKIGATLFGSGYLLVTYLQSSFIDQDHWLTRRQLLDAIAVGQVTPGPLLTTATFVGFILGHEQFHGGLAGATGCALAATLAIFAPSFALIAVLYPWLERLRQNPRARGALDGMNAAVVGLVGATCVSLARDALMPPGAWLSAMLIIGCLVVLLSTKTNPTWLIAATAIIGWTCLAG